MADNEDSLPPRAQYQESHLIISCRDESRIALSKVINALTEAQAILSERGVSPESMQVNVSATCDYDDYAHSAGFDLFLLGYRLETEAEYAKRLKEYQAHQKYLADLRQKTQAATEKRKQKKEQSERQLYEKLREKYGTEKEAIAQDTRSSDGENHQRSNKKRRAPRS